MANVLDTSIEYLKGVGPQKAEVLKKELSIYTFRDLIYFFPFRYVDRTKFHPISELHEYNSYVQVKGKITSKKLIGIGRKQRLTATLEDENGTLELVWFQGIKWVEKLVIPNREYIVFGKPTSFNNKLNITHPEIELYSLEKVKKASFQAIYHSTEKLKKARLDSKGILSIQKNLLEVLNGKIEDSLPKSIVTKYKLLDRNSAFKLIHQPKNNKELQVAINTLKFEELFIIQLRLLKHQKTNKKKYLGHHLTKLDLFNEFYENHLPFQLTNAQQKVIKEIYKDLCSGQQMNRLLQGDVGSGKTIVAFLCMLISIGNDSQACLMAPTEILAEQHFQGLLPFAKEMNLNIELLTGSTKTKKRREILEKLKSGELHIIIGTHALIEDPVQFKKLTLSVIDEQHRFGVAQRAKLWQKNDGNYYPHILVMTATPIPRTLAMTFYGDLDISIIDELPAGRKPIKTVHRYEEKRLTVFSFIRDEIKKGRQVYIVYPMIKESEKSDLNNLESGYESISRAFPEYKISIVHGKMKSEDKEFEMQRFAKKETQIMVATTVIEVGINIPNATVMIIENANRFGLAQLHQLRGRVGRGAEQSYCILITDFKLGTDAKTRLETMCRTNNGFEISETDLKLRGAGDLLGTQQSGILDLKLTDLNKDADFIKECRYAAEQLLKSDPDLVNHENKNVVKELKRSEHQSINWGRIS